MEEYGACPSLFLIEEGDNILTWYVRRDSDGAYRYVGSHGPEGMLSPAQGLVDDMYPFPEHVGIATVVDY